MVLFHKFIVVFILLLVITHNRYSLQIPINYVLDIAKMHGLIF